MKKLNVFLVAVATFFFSQILFAESSEYVVVGKILYQKVSPTQQGATTLRVKILGGVHKIFDENERILLVQGEEGQAQIVEKRTREIREVARDVARGSISPLKGSVLIQKKDGEILLVGIDTGLIAIIGPGDFSYFSDDGKKVLYAKKGRESLDDERDRGRSSGLVVYDIEEGK